MRKITFFLLVFLFFYLEYIYKDSISVLYHYSGFNYEFDLGRYIEAKVLLLAGLGILFYRKNSGFTYGVIFLFFIFLFCPQLIMFEFMHGLRISIYPVLFMFLLISFFSRHLKPISFPKIKKSQQMIFLLGLGLVILLPFFATFGLRLDLKPLLFQAVYDVRADNAGNENIFIGYFYAFLGTVILPIFLVMSINRRKYLLSLAAILMFVYLYLTMANKITFLSLFVILALYFSEKYVVKVFGMLVSMISLFLFGRGMEILFHFEKFNLVEDMLIRRTIFVPALITNDYIDYFTRHPFLFYSDSILRRFFEYPFHEPVAFMISRIYYDRPGMYASTGFLADGYINLGVCGVLFSITVVALYYGYLSQLKIHPRYFGLVVVSVIIFSGSALFTGLVTHALLFLLLIVHLTIRDSAAEINKLEGKHD